MIFLSFSSALFLYFIAFKYWFWGLFTLGTVPKLDDSRVLLAQGIISILLVAFAIMLYVINILDAYRNAERFNRNEEIKDPKARMVATWDKTFPILTNLTRYILIDICSCISINIYVWSSIYKLQFIQRASETHIRMGWFR